MSESFHISPSGLARYFFFDCERFLWLRSAGDERRAACGVDAGADTSPLMQAIFDSGFDWEEAVIDRYLLDRIVIAPGAGPPRERTFDVPGTLEALRAAEPGQVVYQATFRAPDATYARFGIDRDALRISDCHPDLIEVHADDDAGRRFRIVDIKRGASVRSIYRVQILLYALILQDVLADAGIAGRVDVETGGVWLGDRDAPTDVDLRAVRPHVVRAMRQVLPRVFGAPLGAADWHVYFRCEWCDYFRHCRGQMQDERTLSTLAGLTSHGKRYLEQRLPDGPPLDRLAAFLDTPGADAALAGSASLAGTGPILRAQVDALRSGEPRRHGAASITVPRSEGVGLILLVAAEPLGKQPYLFGALTFGWHQTLEAIYDEGAPEPEVFLARTPADVPRARADFVAHLYERLLRLDAFNRPRDYKDQHSLQVYVHSARDRALLTEQLLAALDQPTVASRAMRLLYHVHGPDLLQTASHPERTVHHPVVVLQSALRQLMAMPLAVSYGLPETLALLGSAHVYPRDDAFHFPLGHGLRADAIHAAWHRDQPERADAVAAQATRHLLAVRALLAELRRAAGDAMVTYPPSFQMPTHSGLRDPLMSRLEFLVRYESLLRCLDVRRRRAAAPEVQALLGQLVPLVATADPDGDTTYAIDGATLELRPGMPEWLLVPDSPAGREAQLVYADYTCRRWPSGGRAHPHRAVVAIDAVETDALGQPLRVRLRVAKRFAEYRPEPGDRLHLLPRYIDFLTDPNVDLLRQLDAAEPGPFRALLDDAAAFAEAPPRPPALRQAIDDGAPSLSLTASQRPAYDALRDRRLLLLWGPPGTGKTHFLGSAVVGLAAAHQASGRPLRVLVSAFTHAAIENLLRKIDERRRALASSHDPALALPLALPLGKVDGWRGDHDVAAAVSKQDAASWVADRPLVVLGATFSRSVRLFADGARFDLVVVDEASQIPVPQAAAAISCVDDGGRVVLAGDDRQLPPIVAGTYPDPPEGALPLHRSIFEAVRAQPSGESVVESLDENFRMNDVLTAQAADLLYGPSYTCVDDAVARRRLRLTDAPAPADALDALVAGALDAATPLVVVALEGVRAARSNPAEARLVTRLVVALRERLLDRQGAPLDDATFAREGVFVVCPHHAQIREVRRQLAEARDWAPPPLVDTVDKIQGQQADAVIVSYGVSDPELAAAEADFIYSLNRLNVAVTRARCASILCLPRPLLDAPPSVLERDEAARGLAYMRALVDWVADRGSRAHVELPELGAGVRAEVLAC